MKINYWLLALCLLTSCNKSTPEDTPPPPKPQSRQGVFVCNEGNFMYGNASLSFYDPAKRTVENQLFYRINNVPLGDVCQSMAIIDGKGYVVVNNSGKIYVVDPVSLKYTATISGLTSPRYVVKAATGKLYVSDLYSPSITIVDPTSSKITGYVHIGRSTEQMVVDGNHLYVCSWSFSNKIYKIDTRNDSVIDSLEVTKQPNSMVLDRERKLWVLSDGSYTGSPYGQQVAALTVVDPDSFTVQRKMELPTINASPSELTINATGDTIYFINGSWAAEEVASPGVYRMWIGETALPLTPFIEESNRLFYALGVSPRGSEIYISDAIDYQQKGYVFRYNAQGREIDKFRVDIIPGSFCFY